jgi:hypothetical protein
VTPPNLFIGVVSYQRTQFPLSQGPQGLAQQLATVLNTDNGWQTRVEIITGDLDHSGVTAQRSSVQESLTAELHAEARYSKFISRPNYFKNAARLGARWAMRAKNLLNSPGPGLITRLLNIEASHRELMNKGIESGAPFVLILEDDAFTTQLTDLATGLQGLMGATNPPAFVNLSESFSVEQLGVGHLLTQSTVNQWQGSDTREVLVASRPVTNTVCAILYSREFLKKLVTEMQALPMEPVLAIDWKLNVALMNLFEAHEIPNQGCWWVEPAPIKQMSMHS